MWTRFAKGTSYDTVHQRSYVKGYCVYHASNGGRYRDLCKLAEDNWDMMKNISACYRTRRQVQS